MGKITDEIEEVGKLSKGFKSFVNEWGVTAVLIPMLAVLLINSYFLFVLVGSNNELQVEIEGIKNNVQAIIQTYDDDVYVASEGVLNTLKTNGIVEITDIREFLKDKPAGRTDIKRGLNNEQVYTNMVEQYGELAINCKVAYGN